MITFDVPNLDTEDAGDLAQFAATLDLLTRYVRLKATAQTFRARGEITTALKFEQQCDGVYKSLPTWAKW